MERAVHFLYHRGLNKEQIFAFIQSRSGSREDAEDVFQESMRTLILNIRMGKFTGVGSIQAYVFAICKNLWYKRFQRIRREQEYASTSTWVEEEVETPESLLVDHDHLELMHQILDRLGSRCRDVLEYWQMGYSMEEIAIKVGYKGEHVARKKKSQCFRRLMDLLSTSPELQRLLVEMRRKK